jgi:hypothetical protein
VRSLAFPPSDHQFDGQKRQAQSSWGVGAKILPVKCVGKDCCFAPMSGFSLMREGAGEGVCLLRKILTRFREGSSWRREGATA